MGAGDAAERQVARRHDCGREFPPKRTCRIPPGVGAKLFFYSNGKVAESRTGAVARVQVVEIDSVLLATPKRAKLSGPSKTVCPWLPVSRKRFSA